MVYRFAMERRVAPYGTVFPPYWSSPEPLDLQLRKRVLGDIWGFAAENSL